MPAKEELMMVQFTTGGIAKIVAKALGGSSVNLTSINLITPNGAVVDVFS